MIMCSLCSLNSVCQCGLKRDAHHQDVTPAPTHNHDKKQKWDADTCTAKVPADCFGLITFDGFGQEASKKAPVSYFSWKHHFKTHLRVFFQSFICLFRIYRFYNQVKF